MDGTWFVATGQRRSFSEQQVGSWAAGRGSWAAGELGKWGAGQLGSWAWELGGVSAGKPSCIRMPTCHAQHGTSRHKRPGEGTVHDGRSLVPSVCAGQTLQIIDCAWDYGPNGCFGGYYQPVLK